MIAIDFLWYWGAIGGILIGIPMLRIAYQETVRRGDFDYVGLLSTVAGSWFIALSVVRNMVFVSIFSVVFGLTIALSNWWAMRTVARIQQARHERRRLRPEDQI